MMQKNKARNWYWWLWLSPFLTIPALIIIYLADPGREWICGWPWIRCSWTAVERVDTIVAILGSALWHLILLIPARNKKSAFIRWHGKQALLLAGVRTAIPLVLAFAVEDILGRWLLAIPALIVIWLGGTLWGQRQAIRGDCSLMRWFGQEEQLLIPREAEGATQHKVQSVDALLEIIRFSRDLEERQSALAQLQRRGLVEDL
jgi:hypothetical protein